MPKNTASKTPAKTSAAKVAAKPAASKPAAKAVAGKKDIAAKTANPVKKPVAKPASKVAVKASGSKPAASKQPASKPVIKGDAARLAAVKATAARVEAVRAEAAKAQAIKAQAIKAQAMKAEAAKAETAKAADAKAEAARKAEAAHKAQQAAASKAAASKAAAPKILVAASKPVVEDTTPKKPVNQRHGFKAQEFIVYPSHGVGQILAIEEQEIAGAKLELFVITFIKDKMTLRVPTSKITNVGMRKLSEPVLVKKAIETLKGRARIKRTMWSRRAQEYEAKINSGDIIAIAEVVRDLFRSDSQPEQSYSERQLYEAALDRLSREISAVQQITETEAIREIESALSKGPRRGPKAAEAGADAENDADAESDDGDSDSANEAA